jgi:hypothetical protein
MMVLSYSGPTTFSNIPKQKILLHKLTIYGLLSTGIDMNHMRDHVGPNLDDVAMPPQLPEIEPVDV